MTKPDGISAESWQRVTDVAAKVLDKIPPGGIQLRSHRIEYVALAILAEREACAQVAEIKAAEINNAFGPGYLSLIEQQPIDACQEIAAAIRAR